MLLGLVFANALRAEIPDQALINPPTANPDAPYTGLVDTANAFDATSYFSNAPETIFDVGYDNGI